jgi:SHS2 domain-containing protein
MVIFNTYNHTADAPRFRVIFPTSQDLTSEAYEAVTEALFGLSRTSEGEEFSRKSEGEE